MLGQTGPNGSAAPCGPRYASGKRGSYRCCFSCEPKHNNRILHSASGVRGRYQGSAKGSSTSPRPWLFNRSIGRLAYAWNGTTKLRVLNSPLELCCVLNDEIRTWTELSYSCLSTNRAGSPHGVNHRPHSKQCYATVRRSAMPAAASRQPVSSIVSQLEAVLGISRLRDSVSAAGVSVVAVGRSSLAAWAGGWEAGGRACAICPFSWLGA